MPLELSSLRRAIDSLERTLKIAAARSQGEVLTDLEEALRAGVIQNFEFTYELCWKFMQRWLERQIGPEIDGATRRELFRYAAEKRLIADATRWFKYHEARNKTAHAYDPATAEEIYEQTGGFLDDAKALLSQLEKRND